VSGWGGLCCGWVVEVRRSVGVGGWLRPGDDASRVAEIESSCARYKVKAATDVGSEHPGLMTLVSASVAMIGRS
jgi:hypothetical protein